MLKSKDKLITAHHPDSRKHHRVYYRGTATTDAIACQLFDLDDELWVERYFAVSAACN